jgi:hypothetical protein
MPSLILQNHTPFTKLFKAEPEYSNLRVFGCACYPLLRPYNKHKLEFRSKKCIFLGYSSNHKGYRCMDPTTSRVYLSRNVVFDETCFLAKENITTSLPTSTSSSSFGKVLLPSHFFSINSITTTHTHDTTTSPSNPASGPPSVDPCLSPLPTLAPSSPL